MHLARQPALDREVALKELHSAHVKDAAFAHRFLNESRVAGALNHPSVVSVIEYFEHEGVPFIAMEYLERGSLRPLVGQLTLAQVAGVLDSVLGGLAEAAAQRDRAPRPQARERARHGGRARQGRRLRDRQGDRPGLHDRLPHRDRPDRRHPGLHGARADHRRRDHPAGRPLRDRPDRLRAARRPASVPRHRRADGAADAPRQRRAAAARERPPGPPARVSSPGSHAMLAKEPAARPAGAAHAWDRLEGVVSDALGPRWRRAALLDGVRRRAGRGAVEPAPPSERSGIYSVVLPPVPSCPAPRPSPSAPSRPQPCSSRCRRSPRRTLRRVRPRRPQPHPRRPDRPPSARAADVAPAARAPPRPRPRARRRRAARRGRGDHVLDRARRGAARRAAAGRARRSTSGFATAVAPAVRGRREAVATSCRRSSPGRTPTTRSTASSAAIPATDTALAPPWASCARPPRTSASCAPARRRALSDAVRLPRDRRAALALQADDGQLDRLGALSARLVSRLERIETAVPRASESVGGARRLKAWVTAELAAQAPPPSNPAAPRTAGAAARTGSPRTGDAGADARRPAPTAEPTPDPTATPTPSVAARGERRPPVRRRRARLRRQLEALVAPVPAE